MPFLAWDDGGNTTSWEQQQEAMQASRYSANDFERHHALNLLFGAYLIDRTGTLDNGLKMKVIYPIPEVL